jgi:SAM-dependent methyltransferase
MEYLAAPPFRFEVWGVDASDVAVQRAHHRMARFRRARAEHIQVVVGQILPFEDNFFSLVTCFDMLEHLDEADIEISLSEISRTLRQGGLFFGSVSCRASGLNDQNGDNLHRTVRGVDWWIERIKPDRATYDAARGQLTIWKRNLKRD